MKKYEYKFVKLERGWWGLGSIKDNYHAIIKEEAQNGWRLIQVFDPSSSYGSVYYELIFERELNS